jgi:hypothetical protein
VTGMVSDVRIRSSGRSHWISTVRGGCYRRQLHGRVPAKSRASCKYWFDRYTPPMRMLKPLAWVVPWGLLAGLLLTLVFLGQMGWKDLSGCGQKTSFPYRLYSLPGGCTTIEEGYPVRFLSSFPVLEQNPGAAWRTASLGSAPYINKRGLIEDWLVWSLISCSVLYIVGARRRRRTVPHAPPVLGPAHPSDRRR